MPNEESIGNGSAMEERANEPGRSELSWNEGIGDKGSRHDLNSSFSGDRDAVVETKLASTDSSDAPAAGEPRFAVPSSGLSAESVDVSISTMDVSKETDETGDGTASMPKKAVLERNGSDEERCRICHQRSEEALVELGCSCRGELATAHLSCIELWFRTRGSNKCEICQQVAVNIAPPEPPPNTGYWVWMVEPTPGGSAARQEIRRRVTVNPLWIAFSILMCGLLLDVLISITLGVSALPVNIIIGVLVLLGLGTALRLALDCCHELSLRRTAQRAQPNFTPGFHPV